MAKTHPAPGARISGRKIWLDGRFVDWQDATVHVLTHTLHYGLGVFEGVRSYALDDGRSAVFRLREHLDRLCQSAHINMIPLPYSRDELEQAVLDTLRANGLREGYIRPLVFLGEGAMGLNPADNPTRVAVIAYAWGKYLGEEGLQNGIRAKVSTFSRHHVNAKMTKGKTCGDYVNSILAKREALLDGYDEAIMLDTQGLVSEATGENVFVVRDGAIYTPQRPTILAGITRDTVVELARERNLSVVEAPITRDELYIADEVFLCGTAAEVTPIREVDRRTVGDGKRGPVTGRLQRAFFDVAAGRDPKHAHWLTYV